MLKSNDDFAPVPLSLSVSLFLCLFAFLSRVRLALSASLFVMYVCLYICVLVGILSERSVAGRTVRQSVRQTGGEAARDQRGKPPTTTTTGRNRLNETPTKSHRPSYCQIIGEGMV